MYAHLIVSEPIHVEQGVVKDKNLQDLLLAFYENDVPVSAVMDSEGRLLELISRGYSLGWSTVCIYAKEFGVPLPGLKDISKEAESDYYVTPMYGAYDVE